MPDDPSRADAALDPDQDARPSVAPSSGSGRQSDRARRFTARPERARSGEPRTPGREPTHGWVIETVVSPFHCLYQDALHFHTQSRLAQSEGEAARLARAALLLYISSAEALVRQAAVELGRPELQGPARRSQPPAPTGRGLAAPARHRGRARRPDPLVRSRIAPLAPVRRAAHARDLVGLSGPGRRAAGLTIARPGRDGDYEPMEPHQCPRALKRVLRTETLTYPRTGLPRDPYALRPRHLDTARGILDAAIEALDRRMGGTLCHGQRHRREPVRVVYPTPNGNGT